MESVGIIKVFYPNPTDELNRFSNYKAVRADARLNTMQLKTQIMEKYNLTDEPDYFDILDVMGKLATVSYPSNTPGQQATQSETFMEVSNRVQARFIKFTNLMILGTRTLILDVLFLIYECQIERLACPLKNSDFIKIISCTENFCKIFEREFRWLRRP